jgi:putative FmdB family regulatory protein
MPTYDYRCDACGNAVEYFQSMSDKPKKKCPKCGKSKLVRQLGTGAGILFKGSGFYQTDYRSRSGGIRCREVRALGRGRFRGEAGRVQVERQAEPAQRGLSPGLRRGTTPRRGRRSCPCRSGR